MRALPLLPAPGAARRVGRLRERLHGPDEALATIFALPCEQAFGLPLEAPVATWYGETRRHGLAWSRVLRGRVTRAP